MIETLKRVVVEAPKNIRLKVALGAVALSLLIILEIYGTALIPEWRKAFYSVLEKKESGQLFGTLQSFVFLMSLLIFSQAFKQFVGRRTGQIIRTYLTDSLYKQWKVGDVNRVDNPSQRINEDCKIATDCAIRVGTEVVISASLVILLILESMNNLKLVGSALIYTVIISLVAMLFRKPLIKSEIATQKAEADHRQVLSKISLNIEDDSAKEKFSSVLFATRKYLSTLLGYGIFSASQAQLSVIVPWLILSVPYFRGEISLGDFMSGVAVFELIVVNSTILVTLFPELTRAQASWIRIKEFYNSL